MYVNAALKGNFSLPILLIQQEPRQVVSVNRAACELFGKDRSRIEGARGGQVFDCVHSFSIEGCGKDVNCKECKVKNAIVDSFETGIPHEEVRTVLHIKKNGSVIPYEIDVTTQKLGEFVMVTVNKFQESDV